MFRNSRPGNRSANSLASSFGAGAFFGVAASRGTAPRLARRAAATNRVLATDFTTPPLKKNSVSRESGSISRAISLDVPPDKGRTCADLGPEFEFDRVRPRARDRAGRVEPDRQKQNLRACRARDRDRELELDRD